MARRVAKRKEKDVDYTVAGLVAIVGVVVFTALFFAQDGKLAYLASTDETVAGQAYSGYNVAFDNGGDNIAGMAYDADAPTDCEAQSWCDGSKLVRQRTDCRQYYAFCQYGCDLRDGQAVCL